MRNTTGTLAAALALGLPANFPSGLAQAAAAAPRQPDDRGSSQAAQAPDLDALRARLAEWRLAAATDAPLAELDGELAEIRTDAETLAGADPRDEAARTFLVDVLAREVVWTSRSGDLAATSERVLFLRIAANTAQPGEGPLPTALAARAALARSDVQAVIASLPEGAERAALPAPTGQTEDAIIARAVRSAVARGDSAFVAKLGVRAVPTLRELALVLDGSSIPANQINPLALLLDIDTAAGLDASLELLQRDEFLVKQLVAQALELQSAFARRSTWKPVGETDWELADAGWEEILRRLVDPIEEAGDETGQIVCRFVAHGALPRDLADRVMPLMTNGRLSSANIRVLADRSVWFFDRLLEHPDVNVRRAAATTLMGSRHARRVLAAVDDPDATLRLIVANALGSLRVRSWATPARDRVESEVDFLEVDEPYVDALTRLLLDPNPECRGIAQSAVFSAANRLSASVLDAATIRSLMARVEPQIRKALASQVPYLPEAERLPTLLAYVEIAAEEGKGDENLDDDLSWALSTSGYGVEPAASFWPVVATLERVLGDSGPLDASIAHVGKRLVAEGDVAAGAFLEWLERVEDPAVLQLAVQGAIRTSAPTWMNELDTKEFARFVRLLDRVRLPTGFEAETQPALEVLQHGRYAIAPAELLGIVFDSGAAPDARRWALQELAKKGPEEISPEVVPVAVELYREGGSLDLLAVNPEHPELRQDVLDAFLADATVDDDRIHALGRYWSLRPSTAEAVFERYPPSVWRRFPDSDLLRGLVLSTIQSEPAAYDARMEAANIPGTELQEILAYAIGQVRSEAYFPLLAEVLRTAPLYRDGHKAALSSVTAYLNDDAAALLLETAGRMRHEGARKEVLAQIDQITAYQDAAARWEQRRDAKARRADAIEKLLALADDAERPVEARAEALRGLGLLDAVEELPRLVEALGADEAEIRAAARDALERLHREDDESDD